MTSITIQIYRDNDDADFNNDGYAYSYNGIDAEIYRTNDIKDLKDWVEEDLAWL